MASSGQVVSRDVATNSGKAANNSGSSEAPGSAGPLGSLPVMSGHLGPAANQLLAHHVVDNQLTNSANISTGRSQDEWLYSCIRNTIKGIVSRD
jgi:hypothetical protein